MKKIFSFIVGLVAVTTLQAANYTEAARITMSCAGGSETQQLDLIVDADQATPATDPNLASTYEVGQVNLYIGDANAPKSSYTANAISNLPIVVVTNRRDASYTFTFNVPIATDGLVLTDLRSNEGVKAIPMTNGDSYTFSVAGEANYAANTNVVIADRFVINYQAPAPQYETSLTLNAYGWATFSYNKVLDIPAGLTIYTGEYDDATALYLHEQEYVAANEGVIAKGTANETYYFNLSGNQAAQYNGDNDLKPTGAYAGMKADYDIFVLRDNMLNLLDAEGDFPVNKAFLPVAKSAGAPARISMRFGEATGVENVQAAEKAEKFVQDGQILIRRGEAVYNLQGQMVK